MEPLNEAEIIYLRSRLAMPGVLLGFGLIGLAACVFLLVSKWPQGAYVYLSVLILDLAATYLLFRIFLKLRSDLRGRRKKVELATIDSKNEKGENGPYFLVVNRKPYRVTRQAYAEFEVAEKVKVYSTPAAGLWLGFAKDENKVAKP